MKKQVTALNPKTNKPIPKKTYINILIMIQFILTITLIIFGIITIFKTNLLYVFEIILGITLLTMGINNHLIYKRKNLTILYIFIGIGTVVFGILKTIGL